MSEKPDAFEAAAEDLAQKVRQERELPWRPIDVIAKECLPILRAHFPDIPRVLDWLRSSPRKPALLAFPAGPDRELATVLEGLIAPEPAPVQAKDTLTASDPVGWYEFRQIDEDGFIYKRVRYWNGLYFYNDNGTRMSSTGLSHFRGPLVVAGEQPQPKSIAHRVGTVSQASEPAGSERPDAPGVWVDKDGISWDVFWPTVEGILSTRGGLWCGRFDEGWPRCPVSELPAGGWKRGLLAHEVESLRSELAAAKDAEAIASRSADRWRGQCGESETMKSDYWKALQRIANIVGHEVSIGGSQTKAIGITQAVQARIAELQAVIDKHNLCHDLHGKVGREEFEEGCRRETVKEFGSCGWADRIAEMKYILATLAGWRMFPYAMVEAGGFKYEWCPPGERVHVSTIKPLPSPRELKAAIESRIAELESNTYPRLVASDTPLPKDHVLVCFPPWTDRPVLVLTITEFVSAMSQKIEVWDYGPSKRKSIATCRPLALNPLATGH